MPTRSSKLDLNQLAKSIVDQATGEVTAPAPSKKQESGRKGATNTKAKKPAPIRRKTP
jgi:hypothetical protein